MSAERLPRKPYTPPTLTVYGCVKTLTATTGASPPGDSGMNNMSS